MIRLEKLCKSFNGHEVLKDVSLHVRAGETLVIIGASGCGKTVLLKTVIGLIRPDSGRVIIDGHDLTKMNEKSLFAFRKYFGMLFQGAALFDSMSCSENIALALKEHTSLPGEEIDKRVHAMLERVGLPGVGSKRPSEISGGMKKRVGLARAMIMRPRILLYDEPTTGLDPLMADVITNLINRTSHEVSITSLVVTHDLYHAFRIADRIAMMYEGTFIAKGTPEELFHSTHPHVREFLSKQPIQKKSAGKRKELK
ncbi:MAG TPA: ABC transporter ATP-binding protein [bacterium]|nr:ABC transporter ATP-binding protein [bacterium]